MLSGCCGAEIRETRHPKSGTFIMEICSKCGDEWPPRVPDTTDEPDLIPIVNNIDAKNLLRSIEKQLYEVEEGQIGMDPQTLEIKRWSDSEGWEEFDR